MFQISTTVIFSYKKCTNWSRTSRECRPMEQRSVRRMRGEPCDAKLHCMLHFHFSQRMDHWRRNKLQFLFPVSSVFVHSLLMAQHSYCVSTAGAVYGEDFKLQTADCMAHPGRMCWGSRGKRIMGSRTAWAAQSTGWQDGPEIKSTYDSCRIPEFTYLWWLTPAPWRSSIPV